MIAAAADDIIELELEVPQGQVISYSLANLCSALGITDPSRIAVETDGFRRAMVTIYPSNPLQDMRPVTREDLTMNARGYITVGRYHNGRPARRRLFDPSTGSAQRFLTFGTTGAGKSRVLQMELIAEKLNGIVSWAADLKFGQSIPEARGNVDWFGDRGEEAIFILRGGVGVAQARMARYSAMGRTAFMLGRPDPLLHISIEEANRLLEKGSPYRDEATYLIREIGRTGRSVGVGVRLNAQASHLEELGGSDTLRAMLKEGEVTLLRWSSSMMKQLVSDGLLPAGAQLMPIPKTLKPVTLTSQFEAYDDEEEDAPGTHGTAYLLSSSYPMSMMRHFRVGAIEPLPGLDPEILDLYGDEEPACLEEASWEAAGEAFQLRYDRAAMDTLCATLQDASAEDSKSAGGPVTVTGGRRRAMLLADRIRTVLGEAEEPLNADAILEAVNADGGKKVKIGSIRNDLVRLCSDGDVIRPAETIGLYALYR